MNILTAIKQNPSTFNQKDVEEMGYEVTEKVHNEASIYEYSEFIVVPKTEPTVQVKEYCDKNFSGNNLIGLFSDILNIETMVNYSLSVFPSKNIYYENIIVKSGKNINLFDKISLVDLMVEIGYGTNCKNIGLSGNANVGKVSMLFSTSLNTYDDKFRISFVSGKNVPSFFDIIGEISDNTAFNDIIDFLKQLLDITFSSMYLSFDYEKKSINYLSISTLVKIWAFDFDVTFTYPDYSALGSLAENCQPKIADILSSLNLKNVEFLNDTAITEAIFNAIPKSKNYFVSAKIGSENGNGITIGAVDLTELALSLTFNDGNVSAMFSGTFVISDYIEITLKANLSREFCLEGSLNLQYTDISIWDTKIFKDLDIPDWLKKFELNLISFKYRENDFTARIEFEISDIKISLSIDVSGNDFEISGEADWQDNIAQLTYIKEQALFFAKFSSEQGIKITPDFLGLKTAIALKNAFFAIYHTNDITVYSVECTMGYELKLSNLPIVGNLIDVSIDDFKLEYNTEKYEIVPSQISEFIKGEKGFAVSANVKMADINIDLSTPTAEPTIENLDTQIVNTSNNLPAVNTENSEIKWIELNKTLGIITFSRFGMKFNSPDLTILIDAGVKLGCFNCSLTGLGVTSSITDFDPSFNLDGISMSFETEVVSVKGGLLKVQNLSPDVKFQYDGFLNIQLSKYSFSAIGSFAELKSGDYSFFGYFNAGIEIAVSPAFIVLGLSAGFGYNFKINAPNFDKVNEFPLLKDIGNDTLKELEDKKYLEASKGDFWAAAGIKFQAFGLIKGNFALIAKFGNQLEFTLIGIAGITLPVNKNINEAYANIEIQMAATLKPNEGFFGIAAQLTNNSFLFTKDCKLTGGLAYYMWFGNNSNAGDFVFTIGGYHPSFNKPVHYPSVPRVGFSWIISSVLSIKGEAYLAVTPSCVMAGGRLEAVFQTTIANITVRAWFIAYADFLMTFHPFAFVCEIGVNIGVSLQVNLWICKINLSLSIGASLQMWGTPVGGIATIHTPLLDFNISFGSGKNANTATPLNANQFKELLPKNENNTEQIHSIQITSGLIKKENEEYLLSSIDVSFNVQTAIPTGNISIKPMNVKSTESKLTVNVFYNDDIDKTSEWTFSGTSSKVSEALWGTPPEKFTHIPSSPTANLIDGVTNYTLSAPEPKWGAKIEIPNLEENNPSTAKKQCKFTEKIDFADMNSFKGISDTTIKEKRNNLGELLGFSDISQFTELEKEAV